MKKIEVAKSRNVGSSERSNFIGYGNKAMRAESVYTPK